MSIKRILRWDEPLGLTTVTAMITGCFVYHAPSPRYRKFFICLGWYQSIMFTLLMMSVLVNVFTATDFFSESIESLHLLVTGTHIFAKFVTLKYREKDFLDLFDHIKMIWKGYELTNEELLGKRLSSANKSTVIIFIALGNAVTLSIMDAIQGNIVDKDKVHFPLQIWIPEFTKNNIAVGFLVQSTMYTAPLLVYCATTSLLNSVTSHIEALGLALVENLRRQRKWNRLEARESYRKHQEIIGIVLSVNKLLAGNWGFEMLCSAIQLTLPGYRALRALKRNEPEVVHHMVILLLNFVLVYLIFANGDRVLTMGERIRDAFWETNWYNSSLDERKNVALLLTRAVQPIEYKYKIIHFDLPGFTAVVNTVFSYMALLRFLDGAEQDDAGPGSQFAL